jgi:hypothetical protein
LLHDLRAGVFGQLLVVVPGGIPAGREEAAVIVASAEAAGWTSRTIAATEEELCETLDGSEPWNIIHYIGHGLDTSGLATEDGLWMDPQSFAQVVAAHSNLQNVPIELVYLNACRTRSAAQSLSDAVAPRVIFSTDDIRDDIALQFAARFYAELFESLTAVKTITAYDVAFEATQHVLDQRQQVQLLGNKGTVCACVHGRAQCFICCVDYGELNDLQRADTEYSRQHACAAPRCQRTWSPKFNCTVCSAMYCSVVCKDKANDHSCERFVPADIGTKHTYSMVDGCLVPSAAERCEPQLRPGTRVRWPDQSGRPVPQDIVGYIIALNPPGAMNSEVDDPLVMPTLPTYTVHYVSGPRIHERYGVVLACDLHEECIIGGGIDIVDEPEPQTERAAGGSTSRETTQEQANTAAALGIHLNFDGTYTPKEEADIQENLRELAAADAVTQSGGGQPIRQLTTSLFCIDDPAVQRAIAATGIDNFDILVQFGSNLANRSRRDDIHGGGNTELFELAENHPAALEVSNVELQARADAGDDMALLHLADALMFGLTVGQGADVRAYARAAGDIDMACRYYDDSAHAGNTEAMTFMAMLGAKHCGLAIDGSPGNFTELPDGHRDPHSDFAGVIRYLGRAAERGHESPFLCGMFNTKKATDFLLRSSLPGTRACRQVVWARQDKHLAKLQASIRASRHANLTATVDTMDFAARNFERQQTAQHNSPDYRFAIVVGLTNPRFQSVNGEQKIMMGYDNSSGRYIVDVGPREKIKVKPENLQFTVATHIVVENLVNRTDLNEREGVVQEWREATGRYMVKLLKVAAQVEEERPIMLKPVNCRAQLPEVVVPEPVPAPAPSENFNQFASSDSDGSGGASADESGGPDGSSTDHQELGDEDIDGTAAQEAADARRRAKKSARKKAQKKRPKTRWKAGAEEAAAEASRVATLESEPEPEPEPEQECYICYEVMAHGESLWSNTHNPDCRHSFHAHCAEQWIGACKQRESTAACPTCRRSM